MRPAVGGQPALHVSVEPLTRLDRPVPAEDAVGRRRREVASDVGIPGLKDHRVTLQRAWHVEAPGNVELETAVLEDPLRRIDHESSGGGIGENGVLVPAVPELACHLEELFRSLVSCLLRQEAASAEVLAREGIPRGHHVPGRPPVGKMVERGQLTRHLEGLVEGGVDRARKADVLCDRRKGGEHGERIGPADNVEVVDPTVLLAQP